MKYVVIGASGHHHQISDAMRDGLIGRPAAVAAGSPREDMNTLGNNLGAPVYESWQKMLDEVKPDIAVVNPWYGHISAISSECLRRGIHVYSEKPLATDMNALTELKELYESGKTELGCMLNLNCCGWYKALEKSIKNGDIGEVRMIHGIKSYRMGVRGEHYFNRETYGGTIPWIAIHAVDWVLRLGGKVQWVSASHSSHCNRGNGTMEATSAILLQMENGVIGTVTADFLRPTGSKRHDDDRIRVTGTRGMIEVIDGVVYLENEEKQRIVPCEETENPFIRFVNSIGTPLCRKLAEEAFEDSRICLLAREAADREIIMKA